MAQLPDPRQPSTGRGPAPSATAGTCSHAPTRTMVPWVNFPQFLLALIGISLVVASQVNLPRHLENRELEELRDEQEAYAQTLAAENSLLILQQFAVESDPFYRKERLRRLSGQNFPGGTPLGEWLEFQQHPGRLGPGGPSR